MTQGKGLKEPIGGQAPPSALAALSRLAARAGTTTGDGTFEVVVAAVSKARRQRRRPEVRCRASTAAPPLAATTPAPSASSSASRAGPCICSAAKRQPGRWPWQAARVPAFPCEAGLGVARGGRLDPVESAEAPKQTAAALLERSEAAAPGALLAPCGPRGYFMPKTARCTR